MKKTFTLLVVSFIFALSSYALPGISGVLGTCVGDSSFVDIDSIYGGGTWSSSNPAVATVSSYAPSVAVVTGVSVGTAIITYTLGTSYVTATYTVSYPAAPITGSMSLCAGTSVALSDAAPGGTWSSDIPSRAAIGSATGIVTGVSGGDVTITYSMGTGCNASATVTVNATYTGSITGVSTVCEGATATLISTDTSGGGTWSSSFPSIASISTGGIVTGVAVGSTTISYTVSGVCGIASATWAVTVSSTTIPGTISGPSSLNIGGSATFTDGGGGTWSSSNPAVASIGSSTGLVAGVTVGSAVITYTVSGCGGAASTTATLDVVPFDGISGNVLFSGSAPYSTVKVWLIHFDPATDMLTAIDSTTTSSIGGSAYYEFLGVATDSFRIKAAVYDTTGTGYIPTYHTSNYYWYDATVLYHTSGTYDINQDINMAYGTVTSGPGFIGGNVTSGANRGTSVTVPAVGLQIYVLNSSGNVIQMTTTNGSGNYSFSNLPVGATYTIFPEDMNYYTTAYTGINLTASTPSMSTASFGQHTVSHTILPITTVIKNVTSSVSDVFAFPNPANGKLNIQWNENTTEKGSLTITDITGRVVYAATLNMTQGTGTSLVDLSGLTNGLYLISVKSGDINYNSKIELQH